MGLSRLSLWYLMHGSQHFCGHLPKFWCWHVENPGFLMYQVYHEVVPCCLMAYCDNVLNYGTYCHNTHRLQDFVVLSV